MPATIPPAHDWLANELAALKRRVRVLESRPTTTIYNPSSGVPSTVTAHPIITMGQQIDGTYGHRTFDASGNTRVVVGQMPATGVGSTYAGDYGVLLANSDGSTQALLPEITACYAGGINSTSGSFTSPANTPSLTATIGASGDFIFELGAQLAVSAGFSGTANVGMKIDGAFVSLFFETLLELSVNGATFTTYQAFMRMKYSQVAGATVTPGAHTFILAYSGGAGGSPITFSENWLSIQPI